MNVYFTCGLPDSDAQTDRVMCQIVNIQNRLHTDTEQQGLTLTECLLTLSLLALISSFAIPHYSSIVIKSRRFEAQSVLLAWAAYLERLYAVHNTYDHPQARAFKQASHHTHYVFTAQLARDTYQLEARPKSKAQQQDTLCSTLYFVQTGERGQSGSGSVSQCWSMV